MPYHRDLTLSILFLFCPFAIAKDRNKAPLPVDVLSAHTAWVIVDPKAGVDAHDPLGNRHALDAVNTALAKWGRITPVADASQADLIIVIRKGTGSRATETVGGTSVNAPPLAIGQPTDGGFVAAGRQGPPRERRNEPHPQMEVTDPDDTFAVYRGKPAGNQSPAIGDPLDAPPVWQYAAKKALQLPSVPAVDQFRKAIAESEKLIVEGKK